MEQRRQWGNKAEEQWASESGGIIRGKQGSEAECIFNRGTLNGHGQMFSNLFMFSKFDKRSMQSVPVS